MNKDEWVKKVGSFIGQIAGDKDLSDADYIGVLEEVVDMAQNSITAKKEEMGDDG